MTIEFSMEEFARIAEESELGTEFAGKLREQGMTEEQLKLIMQHTRQSGQTSRLDGIFGKMNVEEAEQAICTMKAKGIQPEDKESSKKFWEATRKALTEDSHE